MSAETILITFLAFLTLAVLVAFLATKVRVPYTIAMVLVGLGAGLLRFGLGPEVLVEISSELILLIFLPGLLFEASYHIDLTLLRSNLRAILLLAIPGVLISAAIIGLLTNVGLGFPLAEALLFGIIISATDPVAVIALFKELGVDKRLSIVIEGESLFNDGVAIVGYSIMVGLVVGSGEFSLAESLLNFVVSVAGGATLGLVAGFLFAELMKRTENPLIDMALTVIVAYGTYLLAEDVLHSLVSPVIAVVVAGIMIGNYGARGRHSATSTTMIITFWEFVVFLINSAIFLIIGLDMDSDLLFGNLGLVLVTIGIVLLARVAVVYGLRPIINLRSTHLPLNWAHVQFWGGLRGAVSIALVLSLPRIMESRSQLVTLVFGCVLFSIVVQGLTLRPLLARLGLTRRSEKQREFEEAVARIAASQAAADALERMQHEHLLSKPIADQLRRRFDNWMEKRSLHLFSMVAKDPSLAEANVRLMQREIGHAQKQALRGLLRRGTISEEVYGQFTADIDEHLRNPTTMDWILSAEMRAGLDSLRTKSTPDEPPSPGPTHPEGDAG